MDEPVTVVQDIHRWLGLVPQAFDPNDLPLRPHESDSHYRCKYPHRTSRHISPPLVHAVPARIALELRRNFAGFYRTFYPGMLPESEEHH